MYLDGLDELDQKIIRLLIENARISYSDIGEETGISRVAVKARIQALEKRGVIEEYTTIINPQKISGAVSCYFEIEIKPEYLAQVTDILYKNDTVTQIYRVTGRDRLHVHAVASSGDEMEYFLHNVIDTLPGIISCSCNMILSRIKDFKLKVQELLLFLDMLDLENTKRLNQYVSGQVETIKEIHSLMTSDLKRHYTIEELSKQYLMNTTTLKSVFKAVYGMPIASYMKEYRMKLASNMLLQEDKSISEIAAAVGYKSQSKFTSAFRDIFQILPTAYQKLYRNQ